MAGPFGLSGMPPGSLVPTTENLARVIATRLAQAWNISFPGSRAKFEKVRIRETKNNFFEALNPSLESTQVAQTTEKQLQEIR